ncbi:hypothetical protein LXA36_02645 [Erwinia amylovora]|nr:hypothetical protein [Erwinia amylovora]CBJ46534.1 hypothetical protein EAM_1859 [Erwinia amylovora ATCC 49946]CDK15372.1 hypothetical protein LA635_1748 [Erwinia amylovora LA635]CDK18738.1 hypothetical protein LA636_1746 [Erwinia amylovora LA636]CDK22108.1 hypothetical protein LA637_1748 [Erwinia amylovora LA637]MCK8425109.1 hypothetical protein [Erwinia amylovora]
MNYGHQIARTLFPWQGIIFDAVHSLTDVDALSGEDRKGIRLCNLLFMCQIWQLRMGKYSAFGDHFSDHLKLTSSVEQERI